MTSDHSLYDPGLRDALRAVQHYPSEDARLQRINELDREATEKGYRRSPEDMSMCRQWQALKEARASMARWR